MSGHGYLLLLLLLLLLGLACGLRRCLRSWLLLQVFLTWQLCLLMLPLMLQWLRPLRMLWGLSHPKAGHVAGSRRDDALRGREGHCRKRMTDVSTVSSRQERHQSR